MALTDIKVPDIGDYQGVDVIEINVSVGDVECDSVEQVKTLQHTLVT